MSVLASRKPHLPALRSQECLSKFPERSPQHLAAVVRPMDMDHGTLQAIPNLQDSPRAQRMPFLCLSKSESLCCCDPSWILVVFNLRISLINQSCGSDVSNFADEIRDFEVPVLLWVRRGAAFFGDLRMNGLESKNHEKKRLNHLVSWIFSMFLWETSGSVR